MRLTGTCVLVLSVFAFAMPAYAGNGNGKGNEGGSDAPGTSANAPGHLNKEEAAAPAQATTTTTSTTSTPMTTTVAAPSEGVKPSNETAHDTHAQAQSNETKLYGNGQTAGQIAIDHGAPGNTVLHGPGNSQPHKATPCGVGHERDAHALKGKHIGVCRSNPSPTAPQPSPTPGPRAREDTLPTTVTPPETTPSTTDPATTDPAPSATDPASGGDAPRVTAEVQGALAGTEAAGGTLPFTGTTLWLAVLVGMVLIATGLALRQIRTAAAPVKSEHDRSDRARHAARSSRTSVGGRSGR
jgi:hypothetical protein